MNKRIEKAIKVILSKSLKSLPIINNIRVMDNIITATNLEQTIIINTDDATGITDGLYDFKVLVKTGYDWEAARDKSSSDTDDYPTFEIINKKQFQTDFDAIKLAAVHVSDDPTKSALQNVCIKPDGAIYGCDGHRGYFKTNNVLPTTEELFINPAIVKIFDALEVKPTFSTANINGSTGYILATFGGITVISKMPEVNAPDYNQVIPKKLEKNAVYFRAEVRNAIKTLLPYTNKKSSQVFFTGDYVATYDQDTRDQVKIKLRCTSQFDCFISFNGKYLLDIIKQLPETPGMDFNYNAALSAVVVGDNHLLMPLRTRGNDGERLFPDNLDNYREVAIKSAAATRTRKSSPAAVITNSLEVNKLKAELTDKKQEIYHYEQLTARLKEEKAGLEKQNRTHLETIERINSYNQQLINKLNAATNNQRDPATVPATVPAPAAATVPAVTPDKIDYKLRATRRQRGYIKHLTGNFPAADCTKLEASEIIKTAIAA